MFRKQNQSSNNINKRDKDSSHIINTPLINGIEDDPQRDNSSEDEFVPVARDVRIYERNVIYVIGIPKEFADSKVTLIITIDTDFK